MTFSVIQGLKTKFKCQCECGCKNKSFFGFRELCGKNGKRICNDCAQRFIDGTSGIFSVCYYTFWDESKN